jgi:FixJ family two-component response regulator
VCAANLLVYVVEDDASVRRAVMRLLRAYGLSTVCLCLGGSFSVGWPWGQSLPDSGCADAGMTGWELLAELEAAGTLPVIMITACWSHGAAWRAPRVVVRVVSLGGAVERVVRLGCCAEATPE